MTMLSDAGFFGGLRIVMISPDGTTRRSDRALNRLLDHEPEL
jgi:hypothetical protein